MNKTFIQKSEELDHIAIRELELYEENTSSLYEGPRNSWKNNFKKWMSKGLFVHDLALKAIVLYYVPMVIESYKKEIGYIKLSKDEKLELAKGILGDLVNEIEEEEDNN
jgi:hypothetical protein